MNGAERLVSGHGGASGHIGCAVGDLPVQYGTLPDIGINTYVANGDAAAEVSGQHRCAGLGPCQIDRLHQRHRLRRTGHALCHHTVIRGEYQQMLLFDMVVHPAGDAGQLNGQLLQSAQAAGRFGQLGLPAAGGAHGHLIRRCDTAQQIY